MFNRFFSLEITVNCSHLARNRVLFVFFSKVMGDLRTKIETILLELGPKLNKCCLGVGARNIKKETDLIFQKSQ